MSKSDATGNPFSSLALERRAAERTADDWAANARQDRRCRFIIASGSHTLVRVGATRSVEFLDSSHSLVQASDPARWSLLGWWRGERCVLIEATLPAAQLPANTTLSELRPLLAELADDEAAVLACARALLLWRARHRHCSVCGAPTLLRHAGHALRCSDAACGTDFFPRIDPAIIVLVSDGDHALLGRQFAWPPGRYSALAGFVEAGESLEDTVIREVAEEVGLKVQASQYYASQAWPFPSSLMLGFHATAARQPPVLDGELEDARWFAAAELAGSAPGVLPPRFTIARRLLDSWHLRVTGVALPARL